jgi:hypothetical protein
MQDLVTDPPSEGFTAEEIADLVFLLLEMLQYRPVDHKQEIQTGIRTGTRKLKPNKIPFVINSALRQMEIVHAEDPAIEDFDINEQCGKRNTGRLETNIHAGMTTGSITLIALTTSVSCHHVAKLRDLARIPVLQHREATGCQREADVLDNTRPSLGTLHSLVAPLPLCQK